VSDSSAFGVRPAPISVSCWGELAAEKRLSGVLRVLVDGQHVGAIWREGSTWQASHQPRVRGAARQTEHATALKALGAVIRSGFARKLGARVASRVTWSDRARRVGEVNHVT